VIGRIIEHYRILEQLGAGGMGVVYKAEDTKLARLVALKFLPDSLLRQPESLERFRREARMASALNHPNICTIHDIGERDGHHFIVMELLEGLTLSRMMNDGPLKRDVVIELALQITDALDAAHARRIVHRDIKPGNIFITDRRQAKLLDFGLAKSAPEPTLPDATTMHDVRGARDADPLTSPGAAIGTVAYMSPEQARGEPLDARTDLFSFGAVLYEMVTGRRAFPGSTSAVVFAAILRENPSPVASVNRDVPPALVRVIEKALEKDRTLRYQSAADMRADLLRMHRADSGRTAPAGPVSRTVAVLPFRDLAGTEANDVWGIGMTDAIIGRLAALQHLAVRPTTAVMKYVKEPADATQAARELEVESVLTGTFVRSGDVVRVSAQLVGGQPVTTKWAGRYDLRADNLLRFQDEVARQVVEGLAIQLSSEERQSLAAPMTTSADAHDLYVRARFHWTQYSMLSSRESLQQGQQLLAQAIALDPSFAHAHALLGFLLFFEVAGWSQGAGDRLALARESAQRAIAIDPQLAEAWIALGAAFTQGGQNEDAIRTLRRGTELAPNSDLAWDMLGYAYHYAGLVDFAASAYRRARELNPTSRRLRWLYARMLLYQDRIDDAIEEMRFAQSMDHPKALAHLGKFLYYAGRIDEAARVIGRAVELRQAQDDYGVMLLSAYVQAARGERDRIHPLVFARRPAEVFDGDDAYWTGGVYALLGERDAALRWFRRAVAIGNHNYPFFARDKNYDGLRGDTEYEAILADVRRHWERYRELFGRG
jgi:non-specific serine/threonine protein kinase